MNFKPGPVHRLARLNYLTRSVSFAFSFIVVLAHLAEMGFQAGTLLLGVLTLLAYPQLAYVHASMAVNSKRADEFLNLLRDSPRIERAQLRMVPDRGFPFVVEIQGNPVRADGGFLQMIVLVCRDLTTPQL